MDPFFIGVIGVLILFVLVIAGMRVAWASGIVGLGGLVVLRGWDPAVGLAGILTYAETARYSLSVLPMFILIGLLAFHAGLTQKAFAAARAWAGRLPGGLAVATVFATAGFAAVSGASTATAAVFTRVSVPEMLKAGYDPRLAAGVVAAGGTLASLIPPSAILVLYGIIVEESIGALLLAGFLPGILSAVLYAGFIVARVKISPELGPPSTVAIPMLDKFKALGQAWGILAVIGIVIVGLYTGWMTPTEVGGIGAALVLLMVLFNRESKKSQIFEAFVDTARLTAMVLAIVWCVLVFVRFLGFTGLPGVLADWIGNLDVPRIVILLAILGIYMVLGMFLDGLGMLLLTMPVVYPVIISLGYDPIWFGILVVKMIEIGLVTPPIGLNCFIVNGVRPDISLETVFRGVGPFVIIDLLTVGVLIALPDIVLWLPRTMNMGGY
ncbi:MAG: TRAP transporter large permease [Rhodospirillaceae bacterium]